MLKAINHHDLNELTKEYTHKLDGTRIEEDKPKYEIVSFHSSRDTFITNCLIVGVDPITIMSWSGHKKYDTFKKYIKLSDNFKKGQHKKVNNLFNFKLEKQLAEIGIKKVV